jgi:hypothetical protein
MSNLIRGLVLLGLVPRFAASQDMRLAAYLNDSTYFEGEPIYVVVELANRGPDTAWTRPLDLVSGTLRGLVLSGGEPLPELVAISHYMPLPGERGEPIAPGESTYRSFVLQSRWGHPGELYRTLFLQHLPPGEYTFLASFVPDDRVGGLRARVEGAPVAFRVRARLGSEEDSYLAVKQLGAIVRDGSRRNVILSEMIAWCQSRLRADSGDPFVPYVLSDGLGIARGRGLAPSAGQSQDLLRMQGTLLRLYATSSTGALLTYAEPLRTSSALDSAIAQADVSSLARSVVPSRRRTSKGQ